MDYYKQRTQELEIQKWQDLPDEFIFPLSQHIGAPAKPVVQVGDYVRVGELIAEQQGYISAPVHSSISGNVKAIKEHPHPLGAKVKSIIIENDHKNTIFEDIRPNPINYLKKEHIIDVIKNAGITGIGGAGFPTYVKLDIPPEKRKNQRDFILLINGAECEPFLNVDYRLMQEKIEDLFFGIKVVGKAILPHRIVIGIEDNKKKAIEFINYKIDTFEYKINMLVCELKTKYPMGAEKILIKNTLDRTVLPNQLPIDKGVVVLNVATLIQVAKTFKTGLPFIDKVITIDSDFADLCGNFRVKLGMPIKSFFKNFLAKNNSEILAKYFSQHRLVLGGPMMGMSQHSLDTPVIKGTSGIITVKAFKEKETVCIRCGSCIRTCPMGLYPLLGADDACIECGLCAYNCPAKINLVQKIKLAKLQRRQERLKNENKA